LSTIIFNSEEKGKLVLTTLDGQYIDTR